MGGWSEGENAFRVFRIYRMDELVVSDKRFPFQPECELVEFLAAADRLGAGS